MQLQNRIEELYENANVFITGGTGFLGKLLISKLIISFPKINKLYLLLRPRDGKNANTRAEELFNDIIFDEMKLQVPNFRQKIVIVNGDCSEENLALRNEQRFELINNVNIVIHGAATVRFNEALKNAININVAATKYVVTLAKEMKNLKAYIHISTAYSNCQSQRIEEKFYDFYEDYDDLIDLAKIKDDEFFNIIQEKLLGNRPNTYTYTKAAAEQIILKEGENLPAAIFRPSIVLPTVKDPIAGWSDNLYGPTYFVVQSCLGWIRVFPAIGNSICDHVPADMVINAIIAVSYETYKRYEEFSKCKKQVIDDVAQPRVYNFISGKRNPITWISFNKNVHKVLRETGSENAILYPTGMTFQPNLFLYKLMNILFHYIPAFFVDLYLKYSGEKIRLLKIVQKFDSVVSSLYYFTSKQWDMYDDNIVNCWNNLTMEDQILFPFDIELLDWENFFMVYVNGVKRYILKNGMDEKLAKKNLNRCYVVNLIINLLLLTIFLCCVTFVYGIIRISMEYINYNF